MNNNFNHINNQVLVQFLSETADATKTELRASLGATVEDVDVVSGTELWTFAADVDINEVVELLEDNNNTEYVGRNSLVTPQAIPNDPSFSLQWGLHNSNNRDIDAPQAWDITTGSDEIVIAVIDTGVDYNHPDLRNNIWVNTGEIPNNGIDDDGNGYVDDYHGYDFVGRDSDPMDATGHGTHVAGIIGAEGNNGIGVSGVAPNVKIMPIRAAGGTTFDIFRAINYVNMMGSRGVNIVAVNNSYSFANYDDGIRNAIAQAGQQGILFVASAGNDNADVDVTSANYTNTSYPAAFDLDNIISVAATNSNDERHSTSNYGANTVDLGAPGASIYSTVSGTGYGYKSGTSMAAPHVTGVAALLKAQNPSWSHQQIKDRILSTVDPVPSLSGITVTGGRLNAHNALTGQIAPIEISINNLTVNENVGNAVVNVNLSRAAAGPITVNYATQNGTAIAGSDYTTTNGTLTIPANQTSATIAVPIIDDTIAEPNETFSVNLSNPNGAVLANNQGVVTVTDNDQTLPRISVGDVAAYEGNSRFKWFNFLVILDAPSTQSVSVTLSTANGTAVSSSDYTAGSKTITFSPGQTQITEKVKVIGDRVTEPHEVFYVNASNPVNATIDKGQGMITILNDDGVTPNSDNFLFDNNSAIEIKSEIDPQQLLGTSSATRKEELFNSDSQLVSMRSNLLEGQENQVFDSFSSGW